MTIEQRAGTHTHTQWVRARAVRPLGYAVPMRRTTIALLLCVGLLFGGCGSFQLYAQGVPVNAPALQATEGMDTTTWVLGGVVAVLLTIVLVGAAT